MLKKVMILMVLASALIIVNADDEEDHSHTGRAGTLVLEPSTGFPGDLIHATGTGWIASYLPCEYWLYFDDHLIAKQGPLTRYEQPHMTFRVPEDAAEGSHQVCIYLVIIWYGYETPVQRVCTTFEVLFKIRTIEDVFRALDIVKLSLPSIMPPGNATSVSAKLDAAKNMILAGNFFVARNQLQAAINELSALSGKTIAGKTVPQSRVEAKKKLLTDVQDFLQGQQEEADCKVTIDLLEPTIVTKGDKLHYKVTASTKGSSIKKITVELLFDEKVLDSESREFKEARKRRTIATDRFVAQNPSKPLTVPDDVKDKSKLIVRATVELENGITCDDSKEIEVDECAVLLARTLSAESLKKEDGYAAVASVILNRINWAELLKNNTDLSDDEIEKIMKQGKDFSAKGLRTPEDKEEDLCEKIKKILASGAFAKPKELPDTTQLSREVAKAAVTGKAKDPTKGAIYFHSVTAKTGSVIDIIERLKKCKLLEDAGTFGGNKFYRPVWKNLTLENIQKCDP